MSCCTQNIHTFVNETVTVLPYTGVPDVRVFYKVGESYEAAGVFTLISISPTQITIDHGGPATGVVKLNS